MELYDDETDDFNVIGLNNISYKNELKTIGGTFSFISAANAFENFDIEEKWLDTRTRTITSFVEKVMKKVRPNNPKNIVPALSSLEVQFDQFKEPGDYFYFYRHNSNFGKLLFHRDRINLVHDYFNPIIRDTSNHNLSAWNPNWWGYEARDVLDFSGVAMDYDGISNGNQAVLITPKHMAHGNHWGSNETARPGDTVYFLEKNTGLRVSANVVQSVLFTNAEARPLDAFLTSKRSDQDYLYQLSGFEEYEGTLYGDLTVFKLDRDVTQPDPNVPGSDGSVKVYKMPRFNKPVFNNYQLPSGHVNSWGGKWGDCIDSGTNNFRLSGSDIITSLPYVSMFGIGAFGRSSWYNHGDEYVEMGITAPTQQIYSNNNNFTSNIGMFTKFNNHSIGQDFGDGDDFSSFHLLSANPYLMYEKGDISKPRLRLGDTSLLHTGDSSNPAFVIAETMENELEMLGPVSMTTSTCPWNLLKPKNFIEKWTVDSSEGDSSLSAVGTYTSIDNILNSMFYSMSGGNPEGYTVGVVDLN